MKLTKFYQLIFLLLAIGLTLPNDVKAQIHPEMSCGTSDALGAYLQSNPEHLQNIQDFELQYQKLLSEKGATASKSNLVYTIPVVVHIVHNGQPLGSAANPTDATIQAIVAEASLRFRHMHPGAGTYNNPFYGVDTEIELCLASQDPNGNYTNGIVRHYDPVNAVGPYTSTAAGLNNYAWNKSLYCNLFIQTHLTNASGVFINDFTIYDGHSPAFWSGLICHEVGHYFSLAHTFSGGCTNNNCLTQGDFICDTPPKGVSGYAGGNCGSPANSCTTDDDDLSANNPYRPAGSGGMGDQPDMLANYLDYTAGCWDSYTTGQKARMRAFIDSNRAALKNNAAACAAQPQPANDAGIVSISLNQPDACTPFFTPQFTLKNYGTATLTSVSILVKVNGTTVHTEAWTGSLAPNATQNINLSTAISVGIGTHGIAIQSNNPNGVADGHTYNDADYRPLSFYGGTACQTLSACANFNPNTFSGPGNNTVVNVSGAFPATPAPGLGVQICVAVQGDVDYYFEDFNVYDESGVLRGLTLHQTECAGLSPYFCFTASLNEYNTWIADGTVTVTLNPVYASAIGVYCAVNQACLNVNVPQTCPAILALNSIIPAGTHKAANSLLSAGLVQTLSTVSLKAGESVELLTGFETQLGATLEVSIEACN